VAQSAAREAVEAISETIQAIDKVSAAIAAAVEGQSAGTQGIAGTMRTAFRGVSGLAESVDAIGRASENVDRTTCKARGVSMAIAWRKLRYLVDHYALPYEGR
jgi:methyl-accepting chemotaxis protein